MSPHFREKLPDAITMPQLFRTSGWFAARVGKLYHYGVPIQIGTGGLDDYLSWDLTINPRGHDREVHDRIFSLRPGQFGATLSWLGDEGPDGEQTDGIAAIEAERLLERFKRNGESFFLAVGFYRPHTPYVAPKRYFDIYPPDRIQLPALSEADRSRTPEAAYRSAFKEQDSMTDEQRREAIQAYWASITFMDAQVGHVLDALDRLGLSDNTIVVFTSDHGYHLGDHGLWQKMSAFERSARVPLIIAAPGAKALGSATQGLAELVDLYPTLADLAGLKPTASVDGVSLAPMLQDPKGQGKGRRVYPGAQRLRRQNRSLAIHRVGWRPTGNAAVRHGHGSRRDDEPGRRPEARFHGERPPGARRGVSALISIRLSAFGIRRRTRFAICISRKAISELRFANSEQRIADS